MTTFAILTLGCKVNQYESQQIRQFLQRRGLLRVDVTACPNLLVVNTCCVTHTASAKSRQLLAQAARRKPEAIVVCGCLPAVEIDELKAGGPNVHVVKDRDDLSTTLSLLVGDGPVCPNTETPIHANRYTIRAEKGSKVKRKNDLGPPEELPPPVSFQGQTRAFLKVQDGCDAFCAYCIIPYARPKVRSKSPDKVVAEAAELVAAGHKEIVLTGVHIGAYGQATVDRSRWPDSRTEKLADLLFQVAQVPNLPRIRLSSLHPAEVTPRLLDVFAAHPNIMPHLHLSLQSGSTLVLARMGRPYTAQDFLATAELVKARLDRPAITTDIIVGFPGETEAEFKETLELARQVAFAKIHVFPYSPRKGTAAAGMPDKITPAIIKERAQTLRALDQKLQTQFRAQFIGQTAEVLIETAGPNPTGRAERYFTVQLQAPPTPDPDKNTIIKAQITQNTPNAVLARLI